MVVVWTAGAERYSNIIPGVNDTPSNLLEAIKTSQHEVSPSTLFAVAAILEESCRVGLVAHLLRRGDWDATERVHMLESIVACLVIQ